MKHDADRIIANLSLYSSAVRYAVTAALRRAAQYTSTNTRRRISRETGLQQRYIKNRIRAARDRRSLEPKYRAWLGYRYQFNVKRTPVLAKRALERPNTFAMPSGAIFRRLTPERTPIEPISYSLEEHVIDMQRIARIGFRRVYQRRLKQELARRSKRAKSAQQARALTRGLHSLNRSLASERNISDGNI